MTKPKTVCQQIVESLRDHPEEWSRNDCTIDNPTLGVSIWTANMAVFDTRLYRCDGELYGLKEKFLVWRAIRTRNRYFQYKVKNS